MTYLFFDTETTGVPKNYKAPVTDTNNWPRLVQLAVRVTDEHGRSSAKSDYIIRPDGFVIPESAAAIHGITTEIAHRDGKDLKYVLHSIFPYFSKLNQTVIAHNLDFDKMILGCEFYRIMGTNPLGTANLFCTMKATTNIVKLPNQNGYRGFKWPKLQELHNYLFGKDFEGAHDAGADIDATVKCFFELKRRGLINI